MLLWLGIREELEYWHTELDPYYDTQSMGYDHGELAPESNFAYYSTYSEHHAITYIPPGEQEITIVMNAELERLLRLYAVFVESMAEVTQAQVFANKVKSDHGLPKLESAAVWKELKAKHIALSYQPSGNYKISAVEFEDGSRWIEGEVEA